MALYRMFRFAYLYNSQIGAINLTRATEIARAEAQRPLVETLQTPDLRNLFPREQWLKLLSGHIEVIRNRGFANRRIVGEDRTQLLQVNPLNRVSEGNVDVENMSVVHLFSNFG